jgi:hypothetical protein
METSALENQRARIYDSPEPCDYTSALRGTKDGGKKLSTRALTGLFDVLERRLQQYRQRGQADLDMDSGEK